MITPEQFNVPTKGTSMGQTSGGVPLFATGTGTVTASSQGNQSEIDPSKGPSLGTDSASSISATGTGLTLSGQQTIEQLQKRIDELANIKETPAVTAEKKSVFDLIKKREDTASTQKSATEMRQEALTQAYQEMGVTPEQIQKIGGLIGEITTYNTQLANLEARKQATLDAVDPAGMTMGFYGGEQNRIAKQFNSEISAKALQAGVKVQELQMIQGAYDDAKKTATEIVNLKTYDQQQELADIEWSLDAHQDLYDLLSKEEQTQWDRQYTTAKDALDTAKKEAENVMDLMLSTKGQVGILITDTYEEAVKKATKWQSTQIEPINMGGANTPVGTIGGYSTMKDVPKPIFTQTQINNGAANAGMKIADFQTLDTDTKNYFINNSAEISAQRKTIDQDKIDGKDPMTTEAEISSSNLPPAAKDLLVRYLWTVFPRPGTESKGFITKAWDWITGK